MFYRACGKRFIDLLFATLAFLLLCPIMLVVAVLVRIKLGSPIWFCQERPGLRERIFTIYKFRTMYPAANNEAPKDERNRIGAFGHFLRATGLDELPQLINIIKGEMSFVGPRPLLVEYLPLYNEQQKQRHSVRPGLTGLAQISGRGDLPWSQKLEYDYQYAQNVTFLGDLAILLKTFILIFRGTGKGATVSPLAYPTEEDKANSKK